MATRITSCACLAAILLLSSCAVNLITPTKASWHAVHATQADASEIVAWEGNLERIGWFRDQTAHRNQARARASFEEATPALLSKVEAARQLLLEHPVCTKCWNWAKVMESLKTLHIASHIRALTIGYDKKGWTTGATYDTYYDLISLNATLFTAVSPVVAASILLHEHTHRVYWMEMQRSLEYSTNAIIVMISNCRDIGQRVILANEGVAYYNQHTWHELHRKDDLSYELHGKDDLSSVDKISHWAHDPNGSVSAASACAHTIFEQMTWKFGDLTCGPPVIVSGLHRGTYFDPQRLAPDILKSLFSLPFISP